VENVVEVLRFASRLYDEWGDERAARFCAEVADQMMRGQTEKRRVKVKVRREKEEEGEKHEERERPGYVRELEERLEGLSERVDRLARELERLIDRRR
jgi:hypothetical protein